MSKTFTIYTADGAKKTVPQLATFTHYIGCSGYRFVVTQEHPHIAPVVTHRASGKKVCGVTGIDAALGDYKVAGLCSLKDFIEQTGAARVRAVLSAAEAQATVINT
jgi:hypothetical protein